MIRRFETTIRRIRRLFSRTEWMVRLFSLGLSEEIHLEENSNDATKPAEWQTGLVMVQIDGLSRFELQKAIERGEMPFLSRLVSEEHYQIQSLYSGLPSSTPSVQAELFYGVKTAVPAFAFFDQSQDRLYRMYDPVSAQQLEENLSKKGKSLLQGGSAYCNIYTGGAREAHFCASSLGWSELLKDIRPLAWAGVAILYLPMLLRAVFLGIIEAVLALIDAVRGWMRGRGPIAEFKFILARVGISILLRDLITIGAQADISRGLPIIHLNYLGYDEQAHRRGPGSAFAHWSLKGIDRCIERLWSASHQARYRHYDLWIYSDHGQESTISYTELTGMQIEDAVKKALAVEFPTSAAQMQSLNEHIAERRARLLGGRWLRKLLPGDSVDSSLANSEWPPKTGRRSVVVAMGPVGHIYLDDNAREYGSIVRLAERLVDTAQVPGVLYIGKNQQICGFAGSQKICLPEDGAVLLGAAHPFLSSVIEDLTKLVQHANAGDLVLLGWVAGADAVSFPQENGSHAGVGPRETGAFALLPADVLPDSSENAPFRPLDLRHRALEILGRDSADINRARKNVRKRNRRPGQLRIMTYNVHSCIGMDSRIAPERIARVIARYQPDVVALQELDLGKLRSNGIDQAELIARMLEMEYQFHPAIRVEEEEYGDAILTHLPITQCRVGVLPLAPVMRPGAEPRGVIWVTLDVGGIDVQLFNTHLGLFTAERREQVRELISRHWLAHPDCQGPTVFCGDLNATPNSPTLQKLKSTLTDVQDLMGGKRLNTFTGRLPTVCIDHVLVREIDNIEDILVPNTELTRLASDHLPVIVDLVVH